MGFIYVDVDIANGATPTETETVHALVDTGATLSVFPTSTLDKLGIERRDRRRLQGFGGEVTRETGGVVMRYNDSIADVTVVFGAEDDPPIMGVTALGTLGYKLDPVEGRLNRVEMRL